jgi:HD superfamily phosphohydrolase
MQWSKEKDSILADLCQRFLTRRLFKYATVEGDPVAFVGEIEAKLNERGQDLNYYLVKDAPKDLPYDVYHPDAVVNRIPILILDANGELEEISVRSDIVQSISGIQRGKQVVYYPEDLEEEKDVD